MRNFDAEMRLDAASALVGVRGHGCSRDSPQASAGRIGSNAHGITRVANALVLTLHVLLVRTNNAFFIPRYTGRNPPFFFVHFVVVEVGRLTMKL